MRVWDLDSTGQVTYWLAAMEKGLIVEMPEKVSMGKPTDPMGTAFYIYENSHQMEYGMVWYPQFLIFFVNINFWIFLDKPRCCQQH